MSLPILTDDFLDAIIAQLRAYAPSLSGRVGGAAQFKLLQESANLTVPAAYVIPLDDEAERMSQNGSRHRLTDAFGVIVAVSNKPDERGQASASTVYGIRRELWRALIGFQPGAEYNGIQYEGRSLLSLDRSRSWWQFDFAAYREISTAETWQHIIQSGANGDEILTGLPPLEGIDVSFDYINPFADPDPGPDGRIEFVSPINPPEE